MIVGFLALSYLCSFYTAAFSIDRGNSAPSTGVRGPNGRNSCAFHRQSSSHVTSSVSLNTQLISSELETQTSNMTDKVLPWRDTNRSPLSGTELRNLVVRAALLEEIEDNEDDDSSSFLNIPGVAWLEHINLIVGKVAEDRSVAESFYLDVMGMTADKSKSFHVNLGRQQFHLATPKRDDEVAHRIHGSIGLAVPDLEALLDRLRDARKDAEGNNDYGFRETLFDFYEEHDENDDEDDKIVHVRCPWGNVFRCYSVKSRGTPPTPFAKPEESPQKMTNLHAPQLGIHGADKMGVLGVGLPGIRFVELILPKGVSSHQLYGFYKRMLRCPAQVLQTSCDGKKRDCCVVSVGAGVHLVFVEGSIGSENEEEAIAQRLMKGVHICIYAHDFYGLYKRLSDKSLIWSNPRFFHLDTCDTWEEAKNSRTLRFRHIVDVEREETSNNNGENNGNSNILMELEHETRPLRHGQFMKVPHYVPK